ncbi:hypothetical protein TNCV_4878211 [Trichonephila clavipes]|nr:hypothetical protein TNCV_4878211 [Trichonephila clavipes]
MGKKGIQQFKDGFTNFLDKARSGRHSIVSEGLDEKVNEIIRERRYTINCFGDEFLQISTILTGGFCLCRGYRQLPDRAEEIEENRNTGQHRFVRLFSRSGVSTLESGELVVFVILKLAHAYGESSDRPQVLRNKVFGHLDMSACSLWDES